MTILFSSHPETSMFHVVILSDLFFEALAKKKAKNLRYFKILRPAAILAWAPTQDDVYRWKLFMRVTNITFLNESR